MTRGLVLVALLLGVARHGAAQTPEPYHADVEKLAKQNVDFRRVLFTGDHVQIVAMSLPANEDIGAEVHQVDQCFFIVEGQAETTVAGRVGTVKENDVLCVPAGTASFAAFGAPRTGGILLGHPVMLVAAIALGIVFLAETSRIPVDDPNTHLELTMVHEVMVLDHSGPDLAFILYGAALKFFLFGALFVRLVADAGIAGFWAAEAVFVIELVGFALLVGVVESVMARLRLTRVPQMLVGASVLSVFALVLLLR